MAAVAGFGQLPALAYGQARVSGQDVAAALRTTGSKSREIRAFYAGRGFQPIWLRDAASDGEYLLRLIASARLDGLDPDEYRPRAIEAALNRARGGDARAVAKAEMLIAQGFVALAQDMRQSRDVGVVYPDPALRPRVPNARELLAEAGAATSADGYLRRIGWMNPLYARLRTAAMKAADGAGESLGDVVGVVDEPVDEVLVRRNLDRLRALPAQLGRRFVLVDAAAARLWMYEDGRVRGAMRVVVGKPEEATPMMAALIRYASVNPYWNLPPDLVRLRVAPGAMASGDAFLRSKRFEVLSGWSADARAVRAAAIDWPAVVSGQVDARVRQLPGPSNAMGRIKFMFPNDRGIYLHDTPDKGLLREDDRLFSSGCVRLEDAPRLARWLFGRPVTMTGGAPERRVDLPAPVPVYITYLTAATEGDRIVYRPDVYGRDEPDERRVASR